MGLDVISVSSKICCFGHFVLNKKGCWLSGTSKVSTVHTDILGLKMCGILS